MTLDKLLNAKHFCLIPWTHLHVWPNGNVLPCCVSDPTKPLAQLKDNFDLEKAWNSEGMKNLRLNMLDDRPSEECRRCIEMEESGFITLRKYHNEEFKHHLEQIKATLPDGTLEEMNICYIDFRFSNLCNFSCRTCGPELSSAWSKDLEKINHPEKNIGVVKPYKDEQSFMTQIFNILPKVEKIYFAGGEPLIMDEHYIILKRLIEIGRTDVQLIYSTNFSFLKNKDDYVIDLWNRFPRVKVGASIDAADEKAGYIRKGSDWKRIIQNRQILRDQAPHVEFFINLTLSIFNVLDVTKLHRSWVNDGFTSIEGLVFNPLTSPEYYRTSVLPESMLDKARRDFVDHISWIKGTDYPKKEHAVHNWEQALNFIREKHEPRLVEPFKIITDGLDHARSESFKKLYPKIYGLLW